MYAWVSVGDVVWGGKILRLGLHWEIRGGWVTRPFPVDARSSREGFADSPSSVQREDVVEIDDHDDDDDDDDDGQNEVANYNLMVFSSLAARRRRSGI